MRFNTEALRFYLGFVTSGLAAWTENFREFSASVTRMAMLSDSGRITETVAQEEIGRLRATWGEDHRATMRWWSGWARRRTKSTCSTANNC